MSLTSRVRMKYTDVLSLSNCLFFLFFIFVNWLMYTSDPEIRKLRSECYDNSLSGGGASGDMSQLIVCIMIHK